MENLLSPRSVQQIFKDYQARRNVVLRALTQDFYFIYVFLFLVSFLSIQYQTSYLSFSIFFFLLLSDVDFFYYICDPEKENLCLYGLSNGKWEVNIPSDEVPPEFPEPILGINFARDGMNRSDWLNFVAKHTDSWLLSVAFFLGVRLNKKQRARLFNLISDLPTIFEILNGEPATGSASTSYGSTERYNNNNNNKKDKGKQSMENDEQVKSKAKYPASVEEIFNNYQARRSAILRALIQEVDDFFLQCDPEKENLWLFANEDGSWEVNFPGELPPEFPEPTLGINFTRDSMNRRDWLISVAKYSDSWLLSIAFFFAAILNSDEKQRLFNLISDLPTTFDIMNTTVSVTLCASYGREYHTSDEFWIGCDICERWFHGECVKITPVKADSIQQYKCPSCSIRRGIIFHLTR